MIYLHDYHEQRRQWQQDRADLERIEWDCPAVFAPCPGPDCNNRCSRTITLPSQKSTAWETRATVIPLVVLALCLSASIANQAVENWNAVNAAYQEDV